MASANEISGILRYPVNWQSSTAYLRVSRAASSDRAWTFISPSLCAAQHFETARLVPLAPAFDFAGTAIFASQVCAKVVILAFFRQPPSRIRFRFRNSSGDIFGALFTKWKARCPLRAELRKFAELTCLDSSFQPYVLGRCH